MYKQKRENVVNWIYAISLFFATDIYLTWFSTFYSIIRYLLLILLLICVVRNSYNRKNVGMSIAFSLLFLWNSFVGSASVLSVLLNVLLPFLLLIPLDRRLEILNLFVHKLFPILLSLSVGFYILWLAGIVNLPSTQVAAVNELKSYDYTSYVLFLIPNDPLQAGRFLAFYDEPGVLGTIVAVILFYYRNSLSIYNGLIYFVTGFLSLSFFFMAVIAVLFFVMNLSIKTKVFVCTAIAVFVIFAFSFYDDDYLQRIVFNRFLIEDGHLRGNTRNVGDFGDYFWGKFIYSGDLLFGTTDKIDMSQGSCSIHRSIYIQGLLFVLYASILYLSLFFKVKVKKLDKIFVADILVWLLLTYQRPCFTVFFYFFFFTTYIESRNFKIANKLGVKDAYFITK